MSCLFLIYTFVLQMLDGLKFTINAMLITGGALPVVILQALPSSPSQHV